MQDVRDLVLPAFWVASPDLVQVPDIQGDYALHTASGEQFKVFTMPKVSAEFKVKTDHKDCCLRKMALAAFASVAYMAYTKTYQACLTNLNAIHVFSVPSLCSQNHYSCIWKENISVISFCVFTRRSPVFYLIFPVGI